MRNLCLGLLLLAAPPCHGARRLRFNLTALDWVGTFLTNTDPSNAQTVRVTYETTGGIRIGKHPSIQDPAGGFTCASPRTCATAPNEVIPPGGTLYTGVRVGPVPGQPPFAADTGMTILIEVNEDRGAILATGYTQITYASGSVNINLPLPLTINGGRPF